MLAILTGCGLRRAELIGLRLECNSATGRAPGDCGSGRQGWPCAHRPVPHVGGGGRGCLNGGGCGRQRIGLSSDQQGRFRLGRRYVAEGAVKRRPRRRSSRRHRHTAPHDLRRTCARLWHLAGSTRFSSCSATRPSRRPERCVGCNQKLRVAVNDRLGIEPEAT